MKFGVGIVNQEEISKDLLINRPANQVGILYFDGFQDLKQRNFRAGSGGFRNKFGKICYGCPYGTYILTSQQTGSHIWHLYNREAIEGNAFETVWDVGLPDDLISVGYDPAVDRERGSIQIHSDKRSRSEGCIVLHPSEYPDFETTAEQAIKQFDLILEISPVKLIGVKYKIMPLTSPD